MQRNLRLALVAAISAVAVASALLLIRTGKHDKALWLEDQAGALLKTNDYEGATRAYIRAAELGNRRATRMVGYLYATGPAPLRNRSRAVHWFLNAKAPLAEEECFVGEAFLVGTNVADGPNLTEALWWLRRSAADGYGPAIELMKHPPANLPLSDSHPCGLS